MKKQLSSCNLASIEYIPDISLYHMDSLYRDSTNDKYEYMFATANIE